MNPILPGHYGIRFRSGIDLERCARDTVILRGQRRVCVLRNFHPRLHRALAAITERSVPMPELLDGLEVAQHGLLVSAVQRLWGLTRCSIVIDNRELLRIETPTVEAGLEPVAIPTRTPVRLSRFAFLRTTGQRMALESARVPHRCVLVDGAVGALLTELAGPVVVDRVAVEGLSPSAGALLVQALAELGFVDLGDGAGAQTPTARFAADHDDIQAQWEFHDLLFHERSRLSYPGRAREDLFPFRGRIAPQPVTKVVTSGPEITLWRPPLVDLLGKDPSLTTAMEGRRSVRQYGQTPMHARQVGEFLYRVARVRATSGPGDTGIPYEISSRPYPSGGACYDLELYLVVGRCLGIANGIYFYDPAGHRLHPIDGDERRRTEILDTARQSAGGGSHPDILIVMASRFPRVAWKYPSIAYRLTTLHVGILYQCMYLVAVAMRLAPCAIGSSSVDLLGDERLEEPIVGAFMVGSLPEENNGPAAQRESHPEWHPVNDPQWHDEARHLLRAAEEDTSPC
ncbi:SagB/ThcOx family dehydrogenase [Nocardia terpenica]|uniref:SagB family peptide dehydrogenase n=1 Tax=Nocardia terpenica TaxID=455432 RepID=UPI002FE1BFE0